MSNLLKDASILLTPTGYENGRMNAIKPYKDLYGPELVTNGDFSQGSTGWTVQSGTVNITDKAEFVGSSILRTSSSILTSGKKYKITYEITSITGSPVLKLYDGAWFTAPSTVGTHTVYRTINSVTFYLRNDSSNDISIDNISVVEDLTGDFQFSRNSAATRVNAQGLVENVQIISPELVSNGNFSQIGTEEVTNGNFSQEGSELVTNGGFSNGLTNWSVNGGSYAAIVSGALNSNNPDAGNWYAENISQNVSFVNGTTYKLTFKAKNISGNLNLRITQGANPMASLDLTSTFVDYTYFYTANADNGSIRIFCNSAVGQFQIDDISVKEVGQDWSLDTGWSIGDDKAIHSGTVAGNITQNAFTSGKSYKVKWTQTNGKFISVYGDGLSSLISNSDVNKDYTVYFNSVSGGNISFRTNVDGAEVTNISVKEVGQDWTLNGVDFSLGSVFFNSDTDGIFQSGSYFTNGKKYKLTFEGSGNLAYRTGFAGADATRKQITLPHTAYLTATADTNRMQPYGANGNLEGTLTNVSVKEITDDTDLPRINYTDGCGVWLLEGQSTNLIPYSEDFSQWSIGGDTVIESGYLAPDGSSNAYKVSGSDNALKLTVVNLTGSSSRTIYAKTVSGTGTTCLFTHRNNTNNIFTITEDWQRFEINSSDSASSTDTFFAVDFRKGDLTELIVWGAQVEQQSYATSYIPTNGATSTRLQDIATNSGNATLINSTEGVLYAEIAALANDGTNRAISINNGDLSDYLFFRYKSNNQFQVIFRATNNNVVNETHTLSNNLDFNKIAFSYKLNEFKLFINGLQIGNTITSGAVFGTTINSLDFDEFNGTNKFEGKAKALAVYKEAKTDANLRCLTYPNPVATTFDLDFDTIAEQFTFTRGSEATFVNEQGLIESTASNDAPRIDYSTGAKAFLLEPQSTNLITYSEDFSNASYSKASGGLGSVPIVTSNYATSPSGEQNADRIQFDLNGGTDGADSSWIFTFPASDIDGIVSVYLKTNDDSTKVVYFRNTFGTIDNVTVNGNWQRYSIGNPTTRGFYLGLRGSQGNSDSADLSVWGAQLEQQSYATSYIPTGGAAATRNQELCVDATPVINSEEGTLYLEASALANYNLQRWISLSDGTHNNTIRIGFLNSSALKIACEVRSGGVSQGFMAYDFGAVEPTFKKCAIKYKQNDFALWIDGVEVATDTSGSVPIGLSELAFDRGGGVQNFFGNTKGLKYYPKALADVQLEDLTTI